MTTRHPDTSWFLNDLDCAIHNGYPDDGSIASDELFRVCLGAIHAINLIEAGWSLDEVREMAGDILGEIQALAEFEPSGEGH